jgi:uncharacterized membrane protein YkoI
MLIAFITLGLLVSLTMADDKKADKDPPKGKPNIVEIDLSKLPPEVAKQLLEATQKAKTTKEAPKPVKTITLIEAITIAEKTTKGEATKADKKGEGTETHFKIDVVGKDGKKSKVELTYDGKPKEKKPEEAPKPAEPKPVK